MNAVALLAAAGGGYLLGSIPCGLLLLRAVGGPDPRRVGSGNIGATNVARAGGRKLGLLTLALDAGKAALAAALAARSGPEAAAVAGTAAVVGHSFPAWLAFRGGKGVACFLGAACVVAWPLAVIVFAVTWLATMGLTRMVSAASLLATWAAAFATLPARSAWVTGSMVVAATVVTLRHRANLRRLAAGTEPRGLRRVQAAAEPPAPPDPPSGAGE